MRPIEKILDELNAAIKALPGEQALKVILLAQELAEVKANKLFSDWKAMEEYRRG